MKKIIGWVVWLLMLVGSINWGLVAMNQSIFRFFPEAFVMPLQYLVGLAGLVSIVMFFMGMFSPDCDSCK